MIEDEFSFTIPGGYSKARAIRYVISEMDAAFAERSVSTLPSDRSEVDEDPGDEAESSKSISPVQGEIDGGQGSETDNSRLSDASAIEGGGSPDERVADGPDNTSIPPSGIDVVEVTAERTEPESGESTTEQVNVGFHFAAGQHCRGN